MYSLIQLLPAQKIWTEQLPVLLASAICAELFFKFHSFLLEAGAFLLTWFVLDAALQYFRRD